MTSSLSVTVCVAAQHLDVNLVAGVVGVERVVEVVVVVDLGGVDARR